ncbi:LOW QUALITY PROTEIN: DEAD box protein 52 homolog [Phlebotomus argentipes]|uniref:LOW QUALITY PROTEIN: DEAD box protein 52 homolog n=1 Tax=Phlebotomus argentipes TaxID=94469 RepID=UPI002892C1C9|nr:LOW QUALITY PROTEIN: DEAD box protein 52 homolog [Phlebotomus argentipes]
MDSTDIFKKLTCGASFKKSNFTLQKQKTTSWKIKDEIKSEPVNLYADHERMQDWLISTNTDEEVKSEPEEELNILDNMKQSVPQKRKKSRELSKKVKNQMAIEAVNYLRNKHKISVNGSGIPPPVDTFDEMAEKYSLRMNITNNLTICGYTDPTPIQMQAMPVMLSKKLSLLACAPTGSGKTAAFLVPIIRDLEVPKKEGFRALIVCPTRELARQILRECSRLCEGINFKLHLITKTQKPEENYSPEKTKRFDILISTPNRICFLLQENLLDLAGVQWLVIDEADKLFEEGKNSFRKQLDQIVTACSHPQRRIALFSATHTLTVGKWTKRNLKHLVKVTVGVRNSATDSVEQKLLFVGSEAGKLLAVRDLVKEGLQPPVLVFVQSKERAQQLLSELLYDGINVDAIHADRSQNERDAVVRGFREGKIWVLICTELMSRGIDFKGVNLVINYDFPPSSISYVHRIGRAGRAGRRGQAVTFFTADDVVNLRSIAQIIRNSGGTVPEYMLALKRRSRKVRRKLMNSAPKREDITTLPKFMRRKAGRVRKNRSVVKKLNSLLALINPPN